MSLLVPENNATLEISVIFSPDLVVVSFLAGDFPFPLGAEAGSMPNILKCSFFSFFTPRGFEFTPANSIVALPLFCPTAILVTLSSLLGSSISASLSSLFGSVVFNTV